MSTRFLVRTVGKLWNEVCTIYIIAVRVKLLYESECVEMD